MVLPFEKKTRIKYKQTDAKISEFEIRPSQFFVLVYELNLKM